MPKQPSKAPQTKPTKRPSKIHKTFRRSYREDYKRDLEIPGVFAHIVKTFQVIFQNWKIFVPLMVIAVILNLLFVGLMSEETYAGYQEAFDETSAELANGELGNVAKAGLLLVSTVMSGGLSGSASEAAVVFAVIIFLVVWLVTIFVLRHTFAGQKIKLRDALYNSTTPLISTFVVLVIVLVQCIPLFILTVVYSAAVQTDFLATPFYAFVFFIFAAVMILISTYFLSSSLIALVAVSAPGLYPIKALRAASDLMHSRRTRFLLRLVAFVLILAIIWVIIMIPMILIDLGLKSVFDWLTGFPFVPFCLLTMTCFSAIFLSAYLYIYYRYLLEYDKEEND